MEQNIKMELEYREFIIILKKIKKRIEMIDELVRELKKSDLPTADILSFEMELLNLKNKLNKYVG